MTKGKDVSEKTHLSANDLCELLNRSKTTIYSLLNKGEIPGAKVGGKWIVLREDLDDYLKSLAAENKKYPDVNDF